jgi:deoxyribonuclease-4
LGNFALENFHGHLAGIAYGPKGEKKSFKPWWSDMNYKDLMKAFKDFNVKEY